METRMIYIKPEVEIVEIIIEGVIAGSPGGDTSGFDDNTGEAYSKKRDFWE